MLLLTQASTGITKITYLALSQLLHKLNISSKKSDFIIPYCHCMHSKHGNVRIPLQMHVRDLCTQHIGTAYLNKKPLHMHH